MQTTSQDYAISRWGGGYFVIGTNGHLWVRPKRDGAQCVDLHELACQVRGQGLSLPVLLRFSDILQDRVQTLIESFEQAAARHAYTGGYTPVYPIKVNQQRGVVEDILAAAPGQVGLEAGSKPELIAVLAMSPLPGGVIVCNGYKDREYIRLALIGQQLGHRVYIVIEKLSELDLVFAEAEHLQVRPTLGVRIRSGRKGSGNWQNSGGEKAKFGLSAPQVVSLLQRLEREGARDCLRLLHAHLGSQIPDLGAFEAGLLEVIRYYAELRRSGSPIDILDVGGGLGIDYEGTRSHAPCSVDYDIAGYVNMLVANVARCCQQEQLPHPRIFTEAGRAMTAHHTVLIAEVVDREPSPRVLLDDLEIHEPLVQELRTIYGEVRSGQPNQAHQQAIRVLERAREAFNAGQLSLEQRALAEQWYQQICLVIQPLLDGHKRSQRELLDQLNEILAEKIFCNFSLFQSLPDVWGIQQVFPVMPLQRLNEPTDSLGILHDITCDSDGTISHYVDADGVETTLPMHRHVEGETYLLGFFLGGAYQEILGDMHNLFGDTDAVFVRLNEDGGWHLSNPEPGDTVDQLLQFVHYEPRELAASYRRKLQQTALPARLKEHYLSELIAGLHGYSYLER